MQELPSPAEVALEQNVQPENERIISNSRNDSVDI
jgi:hypothetical protein